MNSPENSSATDTPGFIAGELVEERWIIFLIHNTHELKDVPRYFGKKAGAVRARIKKYNIHLPPRNHYQGPVLTQQEMASAFFASLAAAPAQPLATLEVVARSVNVTLAPPGGPIVTVPLSAVLPRS